MYSSAASDVAFSAFYAGECERVARLRANLLIDRGEQFARQDQSRLERRTLFALTRPSFFCRADVYSVINNATTDWRADLPANARFIELRPFFAPVLYSPALSLYIVGRFSIGNLIAPDERWAFTESAEWRSRRNRLCSYIKKRDASSTLYARPLCQRFIFTTPFLSASRNCAFIRYSISRTISFYNLRSGRISAFL